MTPAQTQHLLAQIEQAGLPDPVTEYRFAPAGSDGKPLRLWRFDFAWPGRLLALEVDGAVFAGGRHGGARSAGRDLEKRAFAAMLGWRVLPVTPKQATNGTAVRYLLAALGDGPLPI